MSSDVVVLKYVPLHFLRRFQWDWAPGAHNHKPIGNSVLTFLPSFFVLHKLDSPKSLSQRLFGGILRKNPMGWRMMFHDVVPAKEWETFPTGKVSAASQYHQRFSHEPPACSSPNPSLVLCPLGEIVPMPVHLQLAYASCCFSLQI